MRTLLFLIGFGIIVAWLSMDNTASNRVDDNVTTVKQEPKELTREDRINHQFQPDGSFWPLKRDVQEALNFPDSFEHIQTRVMDREDNLFITMEYRAKNALGEYLTKQVSAIYYPDKNEYEIII